MDDNERPLAPAPAAVTPAAFTPAEMSEKTGVSIDTLRYYEREGLLRNVARSGSGHRRYSEDDLLWVRVLRCLRETGMTIEDLRRYCDLGEQGSSTEAERFEMLTEHRRLVEGQLAELHRAIELIDHKLTFYPQHKNHTRETTEERQP